MEAPLSICTKEDNDTHDVCRRRETCGNYSPLINEGNVHVLEGLVMECVASIQNIGITSSTNKKRITVLFSSLVRIGNEDAILNGLLQYNDYEERRYDTLYRSVTDYHSLRPGYECCGQILERKIANSL
ncbi:hypothetical protein TNCV_2158541 [Trichonephila clavipes]|nr:hypothetical protein TNCV_2158541 [Trichonephila clavipes]